MSLSEIIAKLETNESIHFYSHLTEIRVVIKKGDRPKNNTVHQLFVDKEVLLNPAYAIDALAREVDRALSAIRSRSVSSSLILQRWTSLISDDDRKRLTHALRFEAHPNEFSDLLKDLRQRYDFIPAPKGEHDE